MSIAIFRPYRARFFVMSYSKIQIAQKLRQQRGLAGRDGKNDQNGVPPITLRKPAKTPDRQPTLSSNSSTRQCRPLFKVAT